MNPIPRSEECVKVRADSLRKTTRLLTEYEDRFEREYGYLRPVIQDVVEKYLNCGNPMYDFAFLRCPAS